MPAAHQLTADTPDAARVRRGTGWAAAVAWTASVGLAAGVTVGTVIWPLVAACLFGAAGAGCGAVAGNLVAPAFVRLRSPRTVTALHVLGRCLAVAAVAGAALGGLVGLVLGLAADPATAVFAVVEGAILATPSAAAVGVVVALVLVGRPARR